MKVEKIKRIKWSWVTESGRKIGEKITRDGDRLIVSYKGIITEIKYGAIDANGKFTSVCKTKDAMECNFRCPLYGRGACRFNKHIKESVGYYAIVE